MKRVVLLLIAANLGVFGWLYVHREEYRPIRVTQVRPLPENIEPLRLLHERDTGSNSETVTQRQLQQPAEATPRPEEVGGGETTQAGEAFAQAPAELPVDPAPDHDFLRLAAPAPDDSAAASPLSLDGDTLGTDTQESELAPVCHSIGPFPDRQHLNAAMERLSEFDLELTIRASQIEQPSGYIVYLAAMPRAEARAIVRELEAKGVQDYFLGRENVISLGIFSAKRMAEERARAITRLGYEPLLGTRFVTREVFWIDLQESGPQRVDDAQWQALLGSQEDVRREPVACE